MNDNSPGPGDDGFVVPDGAPVDLDVVVEQLANLVAALSDAQQDLVDRIDALETNPPASKHAALRLERHDPAEAADFAQRVLAEWVQWLVAIYRLDDVIPACWERHDALCEELAGFYVAWRAIWSDQARYDAAVLWHEQLYRARDRLVHWSQGARCSTGCGLDIELIDAAHQQWVQRHDQHTRDAPGWRVVRARDVLPAPQECIPDMRGH